MLKFRPHPNKAKGFEQRVGWVWKLLKHLKKIKKKIIMWLYQITTSSLTEHLKVKIHIGPWNTECQVQRLLHPHEERFLTQTVCENIIVQRAQIVYCSFYLLHGNMSVTLKQPLSKNNENFSICLTDQQHLNNLFTLQKQTWAPSQLTPSKAKSNSCPVC